MKNKILYVDGCNLLIQMFFGMPSRITGFANLDADFKSLAGDAADKIKNRLFRRHGDGGFAQHRAITFILLQKDNTLMRNTAPNPGRLPTGHKNVLFFRLPVPEKPLRRTLSLPL